MINSLLWTPLAFGLLAAIAPRRAALWVGVAGALVTLGIAVGMAFDFEAGGGIQHAVNEVWISQLGVHYALGLSGLNVFLVLLSALLWTAAALWAALHPPERGRLYTFMLLLGETATIGAFLAQDLMLFVVFFDAMLIPFYFLIGSWGGENRIPATTKMIIYTLVGSLLMLVGAVATGMIAAQDGSALDFSFANLAAHPLSQGSQDWIFAFFAAAFLVKMPAFLVHGWMPDAYRAAPLPVLALLSGVLSKVGAYGFLAIALPLYPDAAVRFQELILVVAVASILYGSIMAFTQFNVRLIAGYSSVAQLGFITLGIFSLRDEGATGALIQMVNHGLVVAPVFFIIAILAARTGSEDLREMGGLAFRAPVLSALFLIVTLATLAMPGSANFIGELYILLGAFQAKIVYAIIASAGVALAAFYALRLFQRTMHNRKPEALESRELSWREGLVLAPLIAVIVALSLYPDLILDRAEPAIPLDDAGRIVSQR